MNERKHIFGQPGNGNSGNSGNSGNFGNSGNSGNPGDPCPRCVQFQASHFSSRLFKLDLGLCRCPIIYFLSLKVRLGCEGLQRGASEADFD